MQEHVTLLGPEESPADVRGLSSSLPPDLMEQVRGGSAYWPCWKRGETYSHEKAGVSCNP